MGNFRCRAAELALHLKQNCMRLGISPEKLDWEIGEIIVKPGALNVTEQGLHYANLRYGSVFFIEQLPQENLALLALLMQNFIDRDDGPRDGLAELRIKCVALDGVSPGNVEATVEFIDSLYLVPSESGPVIFNDENYDAGNYVFDVAETLEQIYAQTGDSIGDVQS